MDGDKLEMAVSDAVASLSCVKRALDDALPSLRVSVNDGDPEEVRVLYGAHNIIISTIDALMKAQDQYNNPTN